MNPWLLAILAAGIYAAASSSSPPHAMTPNVKWGKMNARGWKAKRALDKKRKSPHYAIIFSGPSTALKDAQKWMRKHNLGMSEHGSGPGGEEMGSRVYASHEQGKRQFAAAKRELASARRKGLKIRLYMHGKGAMKTMRANGRDD